MIGYTNHCPLCGAESNFVLEELECDNSIVAWCKSCGEYLGITYTVRTFEKWWADYDIGEREIPPPISKRLLKKVKELEDEIRDETGNYLDVTRIHFQDFNDYCYTEGDWRAK